MKNIKKWLDKDKKYIFISVIVGFIVTFTVAFTTNNYANEISEDIAESVLRLHIRANSNEVYDQELKLKVRDSILEEFRPELSTANTKEELIKIIEMNYDKIIDVAEKVIKDNGYNYGIRVGVDKTYLETRKYGDIYLPAGTYDALIVEIGSGEGDNWWCVLFPPLCYVESNSTIPDKDRNVLKNSLNDEEYDIITKKESVDVKFKFKIVEIFAD